MIATPQTPKLPLPSGLIPITYPRVSKETAVPNFAKAILVQRHPAPGAAANYCTLNVEKEMRSCGGALVFGWDITDSDMFFEATPHAILRRTDGVLIDVSPCPYGRRDTCFMPHVGSWVSLPNSIFYVARDLDANKRKALLYESAKKHILISIKAKRKPGELMKVTKEEVAATVRTSAPDLDQRMLTAFVWQMFLTAKGPL